MNFSSEDPSSPAASFTGDSGQIFDHGDPVFSSPTTDERVVDTQSGFLVVVKRIGARLSLSVRRHLGTPPSSQIILTPDESIKLSRILGSSAEVSAASPASAGGQEAGVSSRPALPAADAPVYKRAALAPAYSPSSSKDVKAIIQNSLFSRLAFVSTFMALGAVITLGLIIIVSPSSVPVVAPAIEQAAVKEQSLIDFARGYITDLLDFNPRSYRLSQVHAMAAMSPDLMERYWQETKFPLPDEQLNATGGASTILIKEIKTANYGEKLKHVDVHATSTTHGGQSARPIHLRLTVGEDAAGQWQVLDQEDLSTRE